MGKEVVEVKVAERCGLPTDLVLMKDAARSVLVATSKGYLLRYGTQDWEVGLATRVCEGSIRKTFIHEELCFVAPSDGGLLLGILRPGDGSLEMSTVRASRAGQAAGGGSPEEGISDGLELGVVNALAYHTATDSLYIGTEDGDLHCCKLDLDGFLLRIIHTYDHHDDYISALYLSPAKKAILVASGDGTMSVVDVRKKSVVASTKNFGEDITAIAHVAGNKVVLGTSMGALKEFTWNYWGAPSGSAKAKLHDHASINKIVEMGDEPFVVTAADDGCLRRCSLEPLGSQVQVIFERKDDPIQGLLFIPAAEDEDANQGTRGVFVCITSTDASLFVVPFPGDDKRPPTQVSRAAPRQDLESLSSDDKDAMEGKASKKRKKSAARGGDNPFPDLD